MVYKQRFINPNYKSTASKNYAHIRYIATRPRVAKNEGMNHGLFGKLTPGAITEFEDWRNIARLAYQNSKKHITMYRSIISFDEEVAMELLLTDQKAWQRYIENHILTIAEKNHIRSQHLQWACALHKEKGHPHIHVVFWDTSTEAAKIKNPFTPSAIPNAIRIQMIKDTFPDKIRAFGEHKNMASAELRQFGNELVEDFERYVRQLEKKKYRRLRQEYEEETELFDTFDFEDDLLSGIAEQVFRIKAALPPKGRTTYQLLSPAVKKQVDGLVEYLLKNSPSLLKLKDNYIKSKLNMTLLYGGGEEYLKSSQARFSEEADKIIANRILGMVKSLNRLDSEYRSAEYLHSRRMFYAEQILIESLDMLSSLTDYHDRQFEDMCRKQGGDLSKEAKKELYLKYQDKGYEH